MRLNLDKIKTQYRVEIMGTQYDFGWYRSGKAFIAKNHELMSLTEAYTVFVPARTFTMNRKFFIGLVEYDKSIDGIVRYLIATYCC